MIGMSDWCWSGLRCPRIDIVGVRLVMVVGVCWRRGRVHGSNGVAGEHVLMPETESRGVVAAKTTSPHSFKASSGW